MPLRNPPIIELAIGVQFTTERPADSSKLILFWEKHLRPQYPNCSEEPTIDDVFEKFGNGENWTVPTLQLRFEERPKLRYQFSNPDTGRIVQLQSTRMMANWVKQASDYPRYSTIHADLKSIYQRWLDYAAANNVGEVVPNQWELCYVNHILPCELWPSPSDWHRISQLFASEVGGFQPLELEDRSFQWRLLMPERTGRITLTAQQVRTKQGGSALQLTILARGPATNIDEAHNRLDNAHDFILALFDRLATEEAKSHWGITT